MEKFNANDIRKALAKMGMMEFFPTDPDVKSAIAAELAQMCISRESLEWLTTAMVRKVGKWPGVKEMRGIYCSRFPPADGDNAFATIGEFSAEASEGREAEERAERKRIESQPLRMISGDMAADPNEPFTDEQMSEMFAAAREKQKSWSKPAVAKECMERAGRTMKHLGFEK